MRARRIAVTGAGGQLGRQLVRAFTADGADVLALARPKFDLTNLKHLERLVAWGPDVVVNAAAWTDVDACAGDPETAMRVNGTAAGMVAEAGRRASAFVVQVSTNEVFAGKPGRTYVEDDAPRPVNAYGRSKLRGERLVMAATARHLIIRTAWLFGPGGTNFPTRILAAAERAAAIDAPLRVVNDEWGNPTWTPALAASILELMNRGERLGILHLVGQPVATRFEWARRIVDDAGVHVALQPIPSSEFRRMSRPPLHAVLGTNDPLAPSPGDWRPHSAAYVASLLKAGLAV